MINEKMGIAMASNLDERERVVSQRAMKRGSGAHQPRRKRVAARAVKFFPAAIPHRAAPQQNTEIGSRCLTENWR